MELEGWKPLTGDEHIVEKNVVNQAGAYIGDTNDEETSSAHWACTRVGGNVCYSATLTGIEEYVFVRNASVEVTLSEGASMPTWRQASATNAATTDIRHCIIGCWLLLLLATCRQ